MMLLKAFAAVMACLTFLAACSFTGSLAIVYVLEHVK